MKKTFEKNVATFVKKKIKEAKLFSEKSEICNVLALFSIGEIFNIAEIEMEWWTHSKLKFQIWSFKAKTLKNQKNRQKICVSFIFYFDR